MNKIQSYIKEYHPVVHVLIFGTVLITLTSSMSMPFLAIFLSQSVGLDFATIGFIIGVGPLAGTFCGLIGGVLSDFIGRKKINASFFNRVKYSLCRFHYYNKFYGFTFL